MDEGTVLEIERSDIQEIAQSYCKTYAGEPWYQEFNEEEVTDYLTALSKIPGTTIVGCRDDKEELSAFFISYEDTKEKVIPQFAKSYNHIVSTPVGNLPAPTNVKEHSKTVEELLENRLRQLKPSKVLYILDIGIVPDKQQDFTIAKDLYLTIAKVVSESHASVIIAQTLSKGPMKSIVSKIPNLEILDSFPTEANLQHLTLLFDKEGFPLPPSLKTKKL